MANSNPAAPPLVPGGDAEDSGATRDIPENPRADELLQMLAGPPIQEGERGLERQETPMANSAGDVELWKKLQSQDPDLQLLSDWKQGGQPEKTVAKMQGASMRSYYANLRQIKLKDNILYHVWSEPHGVDRDLILVPEHIINRILLYIMRAWGTCHLPE